MNRFVWTMALALSVTSGLHADDALDGGQLLDLAVRPSVQKELALTAEQQGVVNNLSSKAGSAQLNVEESVTALGKTLDAKQMTRLRQIRYQLLGGAACVDAEVQKALSLSAEQIRKINQQWKNDEESLLMVLKVARFRSAEARRKFILMERQDNGKKLLDLLTEEQRQKFTQLQGPAFAVKSLLE